MMIVFGERDDKAAIGEFEATAARHLDRWADEVCSEGAVSGEHCDVELARLMILALSRSCRQTNTFSILK